MKYNKQFRFYINFRAQFLLKINDKLYISIKDNDKRITFFFLNLFEKGLYNNLYFEKI